MTKRKTETVKEFIARGGQITVIPPVKPEEAKIVVSHNNHISYDLMSLGEGEFMFGESRAKTKPMKKRINDEEFTKILNSSNLPQDMIESIMKGIK